MNVLRLLLSQLINKHVLAILLRKNIRIQRLHYKSKRADVGEKIE